MNLLQELQHANIAGLPHLEQCTMQNFLHPIDSQINESHAYRWLQYAANKYPQSQLRTILSKYEAYLAAQVNDGFNTVDETDAEVKLNKGGFAGKLYHGTSAKKAEKIMQQGLRAPLYLTNSIQKAEYYAQEAAEQDNSTATILEIKEYDTQALRADFAELSEPVIIPPTPQNIAQFKNRMREEKKSVGAKDYLFSLKVVNSAKYINNIPPHHIKPLSEFSNGGILSTTDTAAYLQQKYNRPFVSIATAFADAKRAAEDIKKHAVATGRVRQWSKDWMNLGFIEQSAKYREYLSKNPFEIEEYNGKSYPRICVRLGLPPKDKAGSTGYYRGQNVSHSGVSVFPAVYDAKSGYITILTPSESNTMDLWEGIAQKRKLYLVEGDELNEEGTGGEPLLNPQTLKVIGEINMDYALPDYGSFDGETLSEKPIEKNPFNNPDFAKGGILSSVKADATTRTLRTNAAFKILDSDKELAGSDWSAGGCYLLARALQRVYGGKLVMIYNAKHQPQHVAVQLGKMYLDADGLQTKQQILSNMRSEMIEGAWIGEFNKANLGEIGIGSKDTEDKLVKLLSENQLSNGGKIYRTTEPEPLVVHDDLFTQHSESLPTATFAPPRVFEGAQSGFLGEIGIFYYPKKQKQEHRITTMKEAVDYLKSIWDKNTINLQEKFYIVYLNRKNAVIGWHNPFTGGIAGTVADIRIIVATASKVLASSVIVAHNHPSGNIAASKQDTELTKRLQSALKLVDIELLDSLIIVSDSAYSIMGGETLTAAGFAKGGKLSSGAKTITVKVPVSSSLVWNAGIQSLQDMTQLTEEDFIKTWKYVHAGNYMLRYNIEATDYKHGKNHHVLQQCCAPDAVERVDAEFNRRNLQDRYTLFVEKKKEKFVTHNKLQSDKIDCAGFMPLSQAEKGMIKHQLPVLQRAIPPSFSAITVIKQAALFNFSSGSTIQIINGKLYIAGDDSADMLILDKEFNVLSMPRIFSSFPSATRIPKPEKPDVESSVVLDNNKIVLIGSGTLPQRQSVTIVPISPTGKVTGSEIKQFSTAALMQRLAATADIGEINIEGATIVNDAIVLANRGGRPTTPHNTLIALKPAAFWESPIDFYSTIKLSFPVTGVGVSELCYNAGSDTLFFTATKEESPNAYDDAPVGASYLGAIYGFSELLTKPEISPDYFINLWRTNSAFDGKKIEGLCIEDSPSKNAFVVNLVSDNDDGATGLFKVLFKTSSPPKANSITYNEHRLPIGRNVFVNRLYSTALIEKILQQLKHGESYKAVQSYGPGVSVERQIRKNAHGFYEIVKPYTEKYTTYTLQEAVKAVKADEIPFYAPVAPVIITGAKKERHLKGGYRHFKKISRHVPDSFYYHVKFSDGRSFTTEDATGVPEAKRLAWQWYSEIKNKEQEALAKKFYMLTQLL